jgi:transcriptional regulator with XRE-family HTH domain
MALIDEIKAAMTKKNVTAYSIEREIGLSQSMLSRFFNGKVAISLKSLNILLDYLGYDLTIKPKKKNQNG